MYTNIAHVPDLFDRSLTPPIMVVIVLLSLNVRNHDENDSFDYLFQFSGMVIDVQSAWSFFQAFFLRLS